MSAPKSQHDDLFDKWNEWLGQVEDDIIYRLHANRLVWKELTAIIDTNDEIPEADFIRGWITRQHMEAMVLGIRRQTEVKDDVVTLGSLLEAIRRNPAVITRQRFTELCSPSGDENWKLVVDQNFDNWAGPGGDEIDPALIEKRLEGLKQTAANITVFVNAFLAHAAKKEGPGSVSYEEIDTALDEIGKQLTDLYLLLTCKSLTSPEPTIQTPWHRAFSVPWLQPVEVEREVRIRDFIARRAKR